MGDRPGDELLPPDVEAELPAAYVRALRGVVDGHDEATIASEAGVDVAAVPALVRIAITKLLELQRRQRGDHNA